ncbi:MAG: FHA domain-containing protein [Planctomycetaceae bacterium]
MPSLIIQSGKLRGQKIVLSRGEVVFGRDDDCGIRLTSADVSRRHCVLRIDPGEVVLRDLGSSNGTFVNGIPVRDELRLVSGDLLRIGPMEFRVADVEPSSADRDPAVDEWATDDDIATWLETEEGSVAGSDTTIVPEAPPPRKRAERPASAERQAGATAKSAEAAPPQVALGPRKRFESLAEEAADIIRRFQEQEAARQARK